MGFAFGIICKAKERRSEDRDDRREKVYATPSRNVSNIRLAAKSSLLGFSPSALSHTCHCPASHAMCQYVSRIATLAQDSSLQCRPK
eukprot:6471108-Amphidinium_carterae.1